MTLARKLRVTVGVLAHNEEHLIRRVVGAYLVQQTRLAQIAEIIVVSCGSTDATDSMVERMMIDEPRLKLLARPQREGKVGAIQALAEVANGEVLVIGGGDVVPNPVATERLVAPFAVDPKCGMTGARACPIPANSSMTARLHHVLWELHHEMALTAPKLGEVIAIRAAHISKDIPSHVHCDEVLLEALVIRNQARLRYVPTAHVINFPPATVGELFRQRRRIACQHRAAWHRLRYRPASSVIRTLGVSLRNALRRRPRDLPAVAMLCGLEVIARVMGRFDHARGERYRTWSPVSRPTHATVSAAGDR